MLRKITYRLILLSLVCMILPGGPAPAQDDIAVETTGEAGSAPISFEGSDDASLFVGYYRLNPGDTIFVEIISDRGLAYTTMLDDEGYIVLPVLGRLYIADLTLSEVREFLQGHVDEYYQRAWVSCRVQQLGLVKFYVYGAVDEPGFYTATSATTFFDFLQTFGIASETEHRRIVHVRGEIRAALPEPRNLIFEEYRPADELIDESLAFLASGDTEKIDERVTLVDPLKFTLEGEIEQRNFYLGYGDVIYIPDPVIIVQLEGFTRPGDVEVLPGETWADLIRIAGPPSLSTNVTNLVLERRDTDGRLVQLYYNLNYLDDESLAEISVQNRDHLHVLPYEENVYVLGAVNTAGAFEYSATSGPFDYLSLAAGPTPDAHLRFAVIFRSPRDLSAPLEEGEIIRCDLIESLLTGVSPAGVTMEPGDVLYIPDKGDEFRFSDVLSSIGVMINALRLFE